MQGNEVCDSIVSVFYMRSWDVTIGITQYVEIDDGRIRRNVPLTAFQSVWIVASYSYMVMVNPKESKKKSY